MLGTGGDPLDEAVTVSADAPAAYRDILTFSVNESTATITLKINMKAYYQSTLNGPDAKTVLITVTVDDGTF